MTNYEAVKQWTASVRAEKAYAEITTLKSKYPWLKCDESFKLITQLYSDLPKIMEIINQQEKQNAIHREFIRVSRLADEAIVTAIQSQYGIDV